VKVRTYWRKYDRNTVSTADRDDYWRGSYDYPDVAVYRSGFYESKLAPTLASLHWYTNGGDSATVTFAGTNFFPGTKVLLGSTAHTGPDSGLLIKSDRSMELTASLHDLAFGDGFISGRYGQGIVGPPVQKTGGDNAEGILINKVQITHADGHDQALIDVDLQERYGGDFALSDDRQPLLTLGDAVIAGPYVQQPLDCNAIHLDGQTAAQQKCVRISAFVPSSLVATDVSVGVRYPFFGPRWASAVTYAGPSLTVTRQGGTDNVVLLIRGGAFNEYWTVSLKDSYRVCPGSPLQLDASRSLLRLEVKAADVDAYKQLVVSPAKVEPQEPTLLLRNWWCHHDRHRQSMLKPPASPKVTPLPPMILPIPAATPQPAKPSLDPAKPPKPVAVGSTAAVEVAGKGLDSIKTVSFEDDALPFLVQKDGAKLTIILSRKVTRKAGKAVVLLRPANGDFVPLEITVTP
jgi:hypothetical protein